jgi:Tol biopolymer transport system component
MAAGVALVSGAGRRSDYRFSKGGTMTRRYLGGLAVALSCLAVGCTRAAPPPATAQGLLTIDNLINIKHPSEATWAPDGRRLAFVWDQAGIQNIWFVDTQATGAVVPKNLTSYEAGAVENLFWSKDGATLYFVRDGELWQVRPGEGPPLAVWTTREVEGPVVPSPDGTRVAFVRGGQPGVPVWQRTEGDLFVRSLADGREVRLTKGEGLVSGPSWSPDGSRLAFTTGQVNLVSEAPDYSGSKIQYTRVDHQVSRPAFVAAGGRQVTLLAPSLGTDLAIAWLDASRLLVQRLSADNKTREMAIEDLKTGQSRVLLRETDAKFWSLPFVAPDPVPSPDGKWVAFVSDRDGWDNLYVAASAASGAGHEGPARGATPDLVAGQHTPRLLGQRERTARRAAPRDGHARQRSGGRPDHDADNGPRHQYPAGPGARRSAPRLPAHRSPELSGPLPHEGGRGRQRDAGSPDRLDTRWDRSQRVHRAAVREVPGSRRAAGPGVPVLPRGSTRPASTRRSSGSTATASTRTTTGGTSSGTTRPTMPSIST